MVAKLSKGLFKPISPSLSLTGKSKLLFDMNLSTSDVKLFYMPMLTASPSSSQSSRHDDSPARCGIVKPVLLNVLFSNTLI